MAIRGGAALTDPGCRRTAVLGLGAAVLALFPRPAAASQAEWRNDLRGPVARAIIDYYSGGRAGPGFTQPDCLADEGDLCFGGDHEDQQCRRVPRCRDAAQVDRFLTSLEEAARLRPDDAHTVAQAVYAFARLGRHGAASRIAGACRVDESWCALVRGMALHRSGQQTEAEAAFRAALPQADPDLGCRLTGIEELLDERDRGIYRRLTCATRREFEERFWWLSDPLYSVAGNDRWTEHINRRFELVLHERLVEAIRGHHPEWHETALVRRGHEDSWSEEPPRRWTSRRGARYRFTPTSAVSDGVRALSYELHASESDEGYTPGYGPVSQLPGQFARFLEGDSLVVAAAAGYGDAFLSVRGSPTAAASPGDTVRADGPPVAALILSDGPKSFPLVLGPAAVRERAVFLAQFPPAPVVASLEVVAGGGAVGRVRRGLVPLDGGAVVVSDLLFFAPGEEGPVEHPSELTRNPELPRNRTEAAALMLGSESIASTDRVAVYWETYGLAQDEAFEVSVEVEGAPPGLAARVLRAVGLGDAPTRAAVAWTEVGTGATHPRAIVLDVSGLGEGEYSLRIGIETQNGHSASSTRSFRVAERRRGRSSALSISTAPIAGRGMRRPYSLRIGIAKAAS